jgi:hypothetical protein
VTVCGEPVALSAILTEAESAPVASGVKPTVIVQVLPLATEEHVLVCEKDEGFVPPRVTPVTVSALTPVFFNVTVCAAAAVLIVVDAKVSKVGERVATGAFDAPVPVSATVCGEPATLSAIVIAAERAPMACGVKPTVMVQLLPVVTEEQLLVCEKDDVLVPVTVTEEMVRVLTPELVTVMV